MEQQNVGLGHTVSVEAPQQFYVIYPFTGYLIIWIVKICYLIVISESIP